MAMHPTDVNEHTPIIICPCACVNEATTELESHGKKKKRDTCAHSIFLKASPDFCLVFFFMT